MDQESKLVALMGKLSNYHMQGTFTLLLSLARSARHLEDLHNSLPPNQRLLRSDFIALRECWQRLGIRNGGDKIAEEMARDFLTIVRGDYPRANLTRYYRDAMDHGRVQVPRAILGDGDLVLSCSERGGHGYLHFMLELLHGNWLMLGCRITQNQIVLRLVVEINDLDEPLTHRLMGIPALRASKVEAAGVNGGSDRLLSEVDFYFVADATALWTNGALGEPNRRTSECIANGKVFLNSLEEIFRAMGLPCEQLLAIVPWNPETCLPGTHFEDGAQHAPNRFWGGTNWQ